MVYGSGSKYDRVGSFTVDLQSNTATYSQQVMNWFGLTEPHLPPPSVFSKIYPEEEVRVLKTLNRSIANEWNGRHDITYRIRNPAGKKWRYLRSIGQVQAE